jgi:hypothetical protein
MIYFGNVALSDERSEESPQRCVLEMLVGILHSAIVASLQRSGMRINNVMFFLFQIFHKSIFTRRAPL